MKRLSLILSALTVWACFTLQGLAQPVTPLTDAEVRLFSSDELDQMFAPIALYPDPVLAQLLPAATLPTEIVLADRFVNGGGDPELIDEQDWDSSVKALARYPDVIKWMDDNLAWTVAIGKAFLHQEVEVMDSIQRLRAQAQALGNLEAAPDVNVITEDGTIEIFPSDPEAIYIPTYQSQVIYIHSSYRQSSLSRGIRLNMGKWFNHDFDWPNHRILVWGAQQPRPAAWWSYSPSQRHCLGEVHPTIWKGRHSHGTKPGSILSEGQSAASASTAAQSTLTVIKSPLSRQISNTQATRSARGVTTIGTRSSSGGATRIQSSSSGVSQAISSRTVRSTTTSATKR